MPKFPISHQQSVAGIDPHVEYHPEAATQTFKEGAVLIRNAAGFMEEAAAAPATIYGFAVSAGQNLATAGLKKCAVIRAKAGVRYEGTLVATLTQTMAGENYGLVKNADGYWEIVPADTADQVTVAGWSSRVKVGDVNPIVDFTVDAANIQEG